MGKHLVIMFLFLSLLILLIEIHVFVDRVQDQNFLSNVRHFRDISSFDFVSGQVPQEAESATKISVKVY